MESIVYYRFKTVTHHFQERIKDVTEEHHT